MIQILIVDDDQNYRYAVRSLLPWEDHGCRIAGEAVHGKQALEWLEEHPADLIITDISMPQMNGVELIRTVKHLYPPVVLIALSGYDDFAYVKEAMKCGALDYLLKYDMSGQGMLRILQEAKEQIRREHSRSPLSALAEQSPELLSGALLPGLFSGPGGEAALEGCRTVFHLHRIHRRTPALCVLVASASPPLPFSAFSPALSGGILPCLSARLEDGSLAVVADLREIASARQVREKIDALTAALRAAVTGQAVLTVGVGSISMGYEGLRASFEKAADTLQYRCYLGGGRNYHFADFDGRQPDTIRLEASINSLCTSLQTGDRQAVQRQLEELWPLLYREMPPLPLLHQYLLELCLAAASLEPGAPQPVSAIETWTDKLNGCRTLEEKQRFVAQAVGQALHLSDPAYGPVIRQAVQYIHQHYSEAVTLRSIASHVQLSPNYLSGLFRQETGRRVMEHLNEVRIEQAKRIIQNGGGRVYEIAQQVGFDNPAYFSTLFKKTTGMTVNQFKSRCV